MIGKIFDSNSDPPGESFNFILGKRTVIQGIEKGMNDMCIGEKRRLIIPPALGYGSKGQGKDIPGGATLQFDIELISIEDLKDKPLPNVFEQIDNDHNGLLNYEEVEAWFVKMNYGSVPEKLWESEDDNRDGVITWDEFKGPKGAVTSSSPILGSSTLEQTIDSGDEL